MVADESKMERLHCGSTENIQNYLNQKGLFPEDDIARWEDAVTKMHSQKIKNKGELVDYLLEQGLKKGSKEMDMVFGKYSKDLPLR
jgi:hypothetical protein